MFTAILAKATAELVLAELSPADQAAHAGRFATISELAASEKMDVSYVAHVLKLTLLAPNLVEAILDGGQPRTMHLQALMRNLPASWARQRFE